MALNKGPKTAIWAATLQFFMVLFKIRDQDPTETIIATAIYTLHVRALLKVEASILSCHEVIS